ncbi:MAG: hypothetical protein OEY64_11245 [Nitrospinota bacterium]|nr:hypothetical protein [Nitrospinota bacterium]
MIWIKFLLAALVITISGTILTVYSEKMGEKLNISGAFIGLIFLSIVSSLPELGTTYSVIAYLGKPDLAAGNIFGSNTFNMLILAILDFLLGTTSIYAISKARHQKSISLSVTMTVVSMTAIAMHGFGVYFGLALDSFLLLLIYGVGVFLLFAQEREGTAGEKKTNNRSAWVEIAVVVASGAVVVASGYWLALISDDIEKVTGLGQSFIGYIFLAVTTSLPELVIAIVSLRLNAVDMAIGNTIGSCFFNILMFSIVDPFYSNPIFQDISMANLYPAGISLAMILLVSISLAMSKRGFGTNFSKYILLALYIIGSGFVYFTA